jgi:hypothetical protein
LNILPSVLKEGDCYHHGYAQISVAFLLLTPSFRVHLAGDPGVSRPWVYSTYLVLKRKNSGFRSHEKN